MNLTLLDFVASVAGNGVVVWLVSKWLEARLQASIKQPRVVDPAEPRGHAGLGLAELLGHGRLAQVVTPGQESDAFCDRCSRRLWCHAGGI